MKTIIGLLMLIVMITPLGISSIGDAAETVKVGALFPFSGPLALLGNETFNGAIIAADMVNEKGGIRGKKVEWVKGDAVDPKKAMTECERLISVEKLKLIMGTYASGLSYAATEVAEKNKIFYWEEGSTVDAITERGFKYLFRILPRSSSYSIMGVDFANEVVAPKLGLDPKKMRVAIIHEDSIAGTTYGSAAAKRVAELNMRLVAVESYSLKTVDLSSLVMILKDRNPDVIFALQYLQDGLLFCRQAKDLNLNVKAFIGLGACYGMPEFVKTFGDEANYYFESDPPSGINPNVLSSKSKADLKEFQERFNKKFGHIPAVHASLGFSGAQVLLEEVLPKAKSLSPEDLRRAALQVNIPKGGTIMGYGVKFAPPDHPSAGHNLMAYPVVMQWQEQRLWVVYPKEFAVKEPLIPMPTWEERAKGITQFVK
jgi:branched-chain amino acid transport system substrate-binding protein